MFKLIFASYVRNGVARLIYLDMWSLGARYPGLDPVLEVGVQVQACSHDDDPVRGSVLMPLSGEKLSYMYLPLGSVTPVTSSSDQSGYPLLRPTFKPLIHRDRMCGLSGHSA